MTDPGKNTEVVNAFLNYLLGESSFGGLGIQALADNYIWPKKKIRNSLNKDPDPFLVAPEKFFLKSFRISDFKSNVMLKKAAPTAWKRTKEKQEFAVWIVSKWGGINERRFKSGTIDSYTCSILEKDYPSQFGGVASYSKILTATDPNKFAIYDARVAASLNAIQLLAGITAGVAFPQPAGQNKTIERIKHLIAPKALRARGWSVIPKPNCYKSYCSFLTLLSEKMSNCPLYEVEMALFADAEHLAKRLEQKTLARLQTPSQ